MPETREVLDRAQDLSHLKFELVPDPEVAAVGNAVLELSRASNGAAELRYDPAHGSVVDYLIAHECGHAIRFYSAPQEWRYLAGTGPEHFSKFAEDSISEARQWARMGMPDAVVSDLLKTLHHAAVRQVMNYPADLRIERWLSEEYPGLGQVQSVALDRTVRDYTRSLRRDVQQFMPRKVFAAANTMNSAYARYISRLLSKRDLFTPYRRSRFSNQGRIWADRVWESDDEGQQSDIKESTRWAEELEIDGWFAWQLMADE